MRSLASSAAVVFVALGAWIACGGSEQGTPPYSGPPEDAPALSMDDYCAQSLQLTCDALARCCPGLGAPTNCGSYGGQYCDTLRKSAPVGTSYDPVAGAVCVAAEREATSSSSCGALTSPPSLAYGACESIFNGGVAPGGACTSSASCAYQRHALTSCVGSVCVAKPIVGAGAACGDATCDVDLVCATVCVPAAGVGESCATTVCRHDLWCDTTAHTCAALLADGAPCTSTLSCASHQCTGGKCQSSTTCGLGG